MVEESKYCSGMMKKHFNKEVVVTREDYGNFDSSTKCWICDNTFAEGNVKVRGHCQVTGKYSGAAHIDLNTHASLSYKIPIMFQNLKNYDAQLIMQELSKFNFEINAIPNGLEKC